VAFVCTAAASLGVHGGPVEQQQALRGTANDDGLWRVSGPARLVAGQRLRRKYSFHPGLALQVLRWVNRMKPVPHAWPLSSGSFHCATWTFFMCLETTKGGLVTKEERHLPFFVHRTPLAPLGISPRGGIEVKVMSKSGMKKINQDRKLKHFSRSKSKKTQFRRVLRSPGERAEREKNLGPYLWPKS
jgi:hypothetical protein